MLDKANKGHDFVFPPEVKAYIVSHFRMIREENLKLHQSLEKAAEDHRETTENLKAIKGQLEREKAKNKAMLKRLKVAESNNATNHNSVDESQDVIWIQKVDQNRNEMRPPTAKAATKAATTTSATAAAAAATVATPVTTANESRPATARTALVYSSNAKIDPNERKIKMLNKTLKALRVDISNLQKDNENMKQVSLLTNFGFLISIFYGF